VSAVSLRGDEVKHQEEVSVADLVSKLNAVEEEEQEGKKS